MFFSLEVMIYSVWVLLSIDLLLASKRQREMPSGISGSLGLSCEQEFVPCPNIPPDGISFLAPC
jgi:Gpi18-like mannosyltransferase